MNNLKCAIKIMKKNNYIEIKKFGNKFYYYWKIKSKTGKEIINKFKKYFDENEEIVYIENRNDEIKFTTRLEVKKGLETLFEKEDTTRTPIHMNVHKYLNTEKAYEYLGYKITSEIYGHNDLGYLTEIKNIKKIKEKELKEKIREKEANKLLDKLL